MHASYKAAIHFILRHIEHQDQGPGSAQAGAHLAAIRQADAEEIRYSIPEKLAAQTTKGIVEGAVAGINSLQGKK